MFGKLLKNDLKAQWHSMSTIFLCVFFVAVAAELLTVFSSNKYIQVLGGFVVFLALGISCLVVIIAAAMMFSKTMFGRAGYLTLTLPVKTSSLVLSKSISSLIWVFSVFALFIGSLALWIYQVQKVLGDQMLESVESLLSIFGAPSFLTISIGVVFTLINLAITILVIVQALQLSLTCSQVSPISKFGMLGTIVIFFVLFYIIQTVTTAVSNAIPVGFVITSEAVKLTTDTLATANASGSGALTIGIVGSITRLACAIGLHFPIVHLINHKVNVK